MGRDESSQWWGSSLPNDRIHRVIIEICLELGKLKDEKMPTAGVTMSELLLITLQIFASLCYGYI